MFAFGVMFTTRTVLIGGLQKKCLKVGDFSKLTKARRVSVRKRRRKVFAFGIMFTTRTVLIGGL